MSNHSHGASAHSGKGHYGRLLLMTVVSFIAMYFLMYAMVNSTGNVFANVNQVYMAGLMTAVMVIIELALMSSMYERKKLNLVISGAATVALIVFWIFTRTQTAVTDKQFLRSMIPHHAGAILMCTRAPIRDADVRRLCQNIIASQQSEIDQMKAKLKELSK